MHSPRYHKARASSARGYTRHCAPPSSTAQEKSKGNRATSAAPTRPPTAPLGGNLGEEIGPWNDETDTAWGHAVSQCQTLQPQGPARRAGLASPRPPAQPPTPSRMESPRSRPFQSFRTTPSPLPWRAGARSASADGRPATAGRAPSPLPVSGDPANAGRAAPSGRPTPALSPSSSPNASLCPSPRSRSPSRCSTSFTVAGHPDLTVSGESPETVALKAEAATRLLFDYSTVSELSHRICELNDVLERQRREAARKAVIPRAPKVIMTTEDNRYKDKLDAERELTASLRAQLDTQAEIATKQRELLDTLQASMQSKDRISSQLMKQADKNRKVMLRMERKISSLEESKEHLVKARNIMKAELDAANRKHSLQADAFLHNKYLLSNKSVEIELANRTVRKLEEELAEEREYAGRLEAVSAEAASTRVEAIDLTEGMRAKMDTMVSSAQAMFKRLQDEEERNTELGQRLKETELEMSSLTRHLSGTQATLTEALELKKAAESTAASVDFQLKSDAARIEELEEALEKERTLRVSEEARHKATKEERKLLRQHSVVTGRRVIPLTKKYMDSCLHVNKQILNMNTANPGSPSRVRF